MGIQEPESPRSEALLAELRAMGRVIALRREERGISREELARRSEMTVPELEEIERGEREERWGTYRKLAEGLDMPYPVLLQAFEEGPGALGEEGGGGREGRRGH